MQPRPAPRSETAEGARPSLPVAGVGARALAALLDLLLVFLAWIVALVLYSAAGDLITEVKALSLAGQLLAIAGVVATGWGWDVAWEVLWRGQTPGKRALGLRVVGLDGAAVGPAESVVRNALRALELPLGYAPAVLLVALTPRRQRLGDLIAGTLVVQERRYDLSRYGPSGDAAARWGVLRGRVGALLSPVDSERLLDLLARRGELEPAARARIALALAAALAGRAGLSRPPAEEAEPFLEAVAFHVAAEGAGGGPGRAGGAEEARTRSLSAFVRARREGWARLSSLAHRVDRGRLSLAEVEELDRRYRRAVGDLAHARAAFPGTDAEGFLAQVTTGAHGALHRGRRRPLRALLMLYGREAPAAAVAGGAALALSAASLLAGLLAGAGAVALEPASAAWLVPAPIRAALAAGRLWTGELLSVAPGLAGGAILRNNLAVAALAFALGLTGGLGTAALLVGNGLVLGAVTAAVARAGLAPEFLAFLAPHGPAELSALVLAGQGGFLLAGGLILPGEWSRAEALAVRGREGARLLAVALPVLLLAALLEATVSPAAGFPPLGRAALGLGLAAALWAYLWRAGRPRAEASATVAAAPPVEA